MSPRPARSFSLLDKSALLRLLLGYILRPLPKGYFLHPPKPKLPNRRPQLTSLPKQQRQQRLRRRRTKPQRLVTPNSLQHKHADNDDNHYCPSSTSSFFLTRSPNNNNNNPSPTDGPTPEIDRENSLAFKNRRHKIANSDLFYQHWRPLRLTAFFTLTTAFGKNY